MEIQDGGGLGPAVSYYYASARRRPINRPEHVVVRRKIDLKGESIASRLTAAICQNVPPASAS